MVELVRRDFDFGRFCYDDFFSDEIADHLRKSKDYEVCIDFVRRWLRRHDKARREAHGRNDTDTANAKRTA